LFESTIYNKPYAGKLCKSKNITIFIIIIIITIITITVTDTRQHTRTLETGDD